MRRLSVHLFAVPIMILATCTEVTFGQQRTSMPTPLPNTFSQLYPSSSPRSLALKVQVNPKVDEDQAPFHKMVADALNNARIGIPDERFQFFSQIIKPDSPAVHGWLGMIDSITSTKSGLLVNVRVYPAQERTINTVAIIERYSIIKGKVVYVGALEPKNQPAVSFGL